MRGDINDFHYWQCTTLNRTAVHIILRYLRQNSFPMREWHVKHMERTIVRFVRGLSENATRWEVSLNKKYGKMSNVIKRIDYDVKHGATNQQVSSFLQLMRTDSIYIEDMACEGSIQRLNELESHYKELPHSNFLSGLKLY